MQQMQSLNTQKQPPARSNGFTLLEVLISIIIISIGLLGMAGLQVTTLRNNNSSSMRTQATFLAEDMAERMRSNTVGVTAGNYATSPSCSCSIATGCTALDLAAYDLCDWGNSLDVASSNSGLPLGTGSVTSLPNGIFRIRVTWDDDRDGVADDSFDMEFRP
jgi:type IV pilus assembly protein PilV